MNFKIINFPPLKRLQKKDQGDLQVRLPKISVNNAFFLLLPWVALDLPHLLLVLLQDPLVVFLLQQTILLQELLHAYFEILMLLEKPQKSLCYLTSLCDLLKIRYDLLVVCNFMLSRGNVLEIGY